MKYLKIKDWDKWQTFRKDRGTPPWIKVYRNLFSNPEWMELSDSEKGQLISMWVAAADKSGKLPNSSKIIQKMCFLDEPPKLQRFKDLGFLDGNTTTTDDNQPTTINKDHDNHLPTVKENHDQPETETETETETEKHIGVSDKKTEELSRSQKLVLFEPRWLGYEGEKDNKKIALGYWNAKIKTKEDVADYDKAVINYYAIVAADRKNGFPDRRLKGGKTWFNNYESYINQKPPEQKPKDGIQRPESKGESELKELCIKQLHFSKDELKEGAEWHYQIFHMALVRHVLEYEQRFGNSPFEDEDNKIYLTLKEEMMGETE